MKQLQFAGLDYGALAAGVLLAAGMIALRVFGL